MLWAAYVVLVILLLYWAVDRQTTGGLDISVRYQQPVPKWVKDRMKYHGIVHCYRKYDGGYYFLRDGKECRL